MFDNFFAEARLSLAPQEIQKSKSLSRKKIESVEKTKSMNLNIANFETKTCQDKIMQTSVRRKLTKRQQSRKYLGRNLLSRKKIQKDLRLKSYQVPLILKTHAHKYTHTHIHTHFIRSSLKQNDTTKPI